MAELKLKVCGMKHPDNIRGLVDLKPDFIGFIFYAKSPRYVNTLDEQSIVGIPSDTSRVGVFVNESMENIVSLADQYKLDYIQLHGDEDLSFANALRERGLKIIKVFRVQDEIPAYARNYQGIADYLLFDTASVNYGGSGKHFDWEILSNYDMDIPFLLSGGIELEDVKAIRKMSIPQLAGIDVNSRFEIEPGLKDIEKVRILKQELCSME
ncbi:MAG: phosphoribosylanthranilate isomerase [Ekhidna sp.]|nr:phosphoribosylanthranilate isomerase [Ekhidna sp.]